jgi:hypothetical protein
MYVTILDASCQQNPDGDGPYLQRSGLLRTEGRNAFLRTQPSTIDEKISASLASLDA